MSKSKHLTYEERFFIEKSLSAGDSCRTIAGKLHRSKTAINNEIDKNGGRYSYKAFKADNKAYFKQLYKKKECNKAVKNPDLRKFVEDKLERGWSPESISCRTSAQSGVEYISEKSIRKYIAKRPSFEAALFWGRNHKKSGPKKSRNCYLKDPDRKFIDQRDAEFSLLSCLEYGHWEGDFIVSKQSSVVLLVLVERYSRERIIAILPNRDNSLVNEYISSLLGSRTVKSLTLDNDIAFQKWRDLEGELKCGVYFTHPYCSWEKGLVENTNRWIRSFIPKSVDIGLVSKSALQSLQDYMNHIPRECLDGLTSHEVMMFCEERRSVVSPLIDLPEKIIS